MDVGACETPMSDHIFRFWQHLETEHVRILLDLRRDTSSVVYWDSSSFSDDVAKALVAERAALRQALEEIASGTIDKLPPYRAVPADVLRQMARDALKDVVQRQQPQDSAGLPETCKCGRCQLVPPEQLVAWHDELIRYRKACEDIFAMYRYIDPQKPQLFANSIVKILRDIRYGASAAVRRGTNMNEDQSPSNELGHQVLEALTIAADVVCDTKCPSVWKTGEKPPHSDECKKVGAARSAWMDFLSYGDLIASGGLAGAPQPMSSKDSDGQPSAGGMQMSATGSAITRRPAHPMDTISGGPIGPSEALSPVPSQGRGGAPSHQRSQGE